MGIVGIEASNQGHSCQEDDVYGVDLQKDAVARIRRVQIITMCIGFQMGLIHIEWVYSRFIKSNIQDNLMEQCHM